MATLIRLPQPEFGKTKEDPLNRPFSLPGELGIPLIEDTQRSRPVRGGEVNPRVDNARGNVIYSGRSEVTYYHVGDNYTPSNVTATGRNARITGTSVTLDGEKYEVHFAAIKISEFEKIAREIAKEEGWRYSLVEAKKRLLSNPNSGKPFDGLCAKITKPNGEKMIVVFDDLGGLPEKNKHDNAPHFIDVRTTPGRVPIPTGTYNVTIGRGLKSVI